LSNKYEKNYDISEPTLSMEIDILRKSPITAGGCKIIREVLWEENLHIGSIKMVTQNWHGAVGAEGIIKCKSSNVIK
jgi:hypothetical protein